ncbi:hypothetical protein [Roseateles noduli]|uniref:hypothetical protein n=1 Tax=Roseateles noduli TaxID=2052484 RepID=UPI003D658ED3
MPNSSLSLQAAQLEFEFTLRYSLDEHEVLVDAVMKRLEQTGCADTLVGAGITGVLELQFSRRAATAEEALNSATEAVRRAFASARLVKVIPAPDTPTAS